MCMHLQQRVRSTQRHSKMTIYHETMRDCGDPHMNMFFKVTSGSYHNATRNATKPLPESCQMVARWQHFTILPSLETYSRIVTILVLSCYQKCYQYHLATIKQQETETSVPNYYHRFLLELIVFELIYLRAPLDRRVVLGIMVEDNLIHG